MFDMGFWEMSLIFVILLVVVGPDRLPGVIRTVGLWVGRARRIVSSVRHEVERELKVSEIRQSIDQEVKSDEFRRLADQVKSINKDVDGTEKELKQELKPTQSEQAATATSTDKLAKTSTVPSEPRG